LKAMVNSKAIRARSIMPVKALALAFHKQSVECTEATVMPTALETMRKSRTTPQEELD